MVRVKMAVKIELTETQKQEWLYYETGFEQLNPLLEIHYWMEQRGYKYGDDWFCMNDRTNGNKKRYWLEFPDEEIATMFMIRWSSTA